MAVNFQGWLQHAVRVNATLRAVDCWNRIQENPKTILFTTESGSVVEAQSLRIDGLRQRTVSEEMTAGGVLGGYVNVLVLLGVKGHPSVPDTNVARGYTFVLGADLYRVIDIVEFPGELQIMAEAVS